MRLIPAIAGTAGTDGAAAGIVGAAALREAATGEYSQIIELVRAALIARLGLADQGWRLCLEAMFADRAIVARDGRYFAYPYTLGADNTVTLGEPVEVIEQYLPVGLREAREAELAGVTFVEARDAEGSVWEVVVIRAGLSHNKNFYPDTVLREAAPLFEGARVFAKPDAEHVKGGGRDVNKVVGWIASPRFAEGRAPDTGRISATMHLTSGAANLRSTIVDAWKKGKKDLVGLSIDATGRAKTELRESKSVRVAQAITKVNSVDLIVEPSAGGGLVRLVEAAASEEHEDMALRQRMLDTIKAKKPALFATLNPTTISDEDLEARYAEALVEPAQAPKDDTQAGPALTREEFDEKMRMIEARSTARRLVGGSKLPAKAQEKLLKRLDGLVSFTEADVTAAIKDEREYLASFTESGRVVVPFDQVEVEDRSAKIADMLDAFFDPKHKNHRSVQSFKEAYIEITGDRRVTGRMEDVDRARLREAMGDAFRESLDSTSLAYVLGTSITRRMIADYRDMGQYDVWRNACEVVPVSDFRSNERTRYGGYGDLPDVAEGAPYTALGSPTDERATYAASKRGGTEDVTIETVKNDDVGLIRRIPINLSRAAKRTLAKFVLDFVRTNPAIYDSVAFFHNDHGNLGSNALDATYLAAARLAMLKQAELTSADRIGIPPKFLWVPFDKEQTAVDLFKLSTSNDKSFLASLSLTVMPVWYWTDTNDWAISADVMDCPGIEVGFLDGREEPDLFVQDNPSVGSLFTNDKITWKIRHIYGGAVKDYRGWYKAVVA